MKKFFIIFLLFLFILLVFWGIYSLVKFLKTDLFLSTNKKLYYHWEFIKITAKIKTKKLAEKYKTEPFYVSVFKDKNRIITIGGLGKIPLIYNSKKMVWEGKWPCPWNADDGKYYIEPFLAQNIKFSTTHFFIKRRKLKRVFPRGFGILTFENATTLSTLKMKNPNGKETGFKGMFDWTEFIGADAFWYLAGQTKAETPNPDEHFPWTEKNISKLPELGKEAHNRGLKFGTYIISYLTYGHYKYKNYRYAYDYIAEEGGPVETRAISLADEKRVSDIIKLVRVLNDIPEIDYIGLDYIRNALGGYELVDEFVQEINVKLPEGWEKYNATRRMAWLANEKVARLNMSLIDQWQWWRAHRVAKIIKRITTEVKLKKPLWVFTLSWEKGWQHGQDPVMVADAGADIDAVMLYETDRDRFNILLDDWHNYIKKIQANIIVGNVVDFPLHQKILNPPAPEEFYNRIVEATKKIYNDTIVDSVFVHDLSRALWGRISPYPTIEWLLAGASAITEMRKINGLLTVSAEINLSPKIRINEQFLIPVVIKNTSKKKLKNLVVRIFLIGGEIKGTNQKTITELYPNQTQILNFNGIIKIPAWEKELKNMVAIQVKSDKQRNATFFRYVTAR
ncbi:MAG: hypothetical protein AB1349_11330 [Elusimicrobiota bacterium]